MNFEASLLKLQMEVKELTKVKKQNLKNIIRVLDFITKNYNIKSIQFGKYESIKYYGEDPEDHIKCRLWLSGHSPLCFNICENDVDRTKFLIFIHETTYRPAFK